MVNKRSISSTEEIEIDTQTEQDRFKEFALKLNELRTDRKKESELKVFKSPDGSYNFISEESQEARKIKKSWLMIKTNATEKTLWDLFIIILAVYNCF